MEKLKGIEVIGVIKVDDKVKGGETIIARIQE